MRRWGADFDPDRLADLETALWKAYYRKQPARLFGSLVEAIRERAMFPGRGPSRSVAPEGSAVEGRYSSPGRRPTTHHATGNAAAARTSFKASPIRNGVTPFAIPVPRSRWATLISHGTPTR